MLTRRSVLRRIAAGATLLPFVASLWGKARGTPPPVRNRRVYHANGREIVFEWEGTAEIGLYPSRGVVVSGPK